MLKTLKHWLKESKRIELTDPDFALFSKNFEKFAESLIDNADYIFIFALSIKVQTTMYPEVKMHYLCAAFHLCTLAQNKPQPYPFIKYALGLMHFYGLGTQRNVQIANELLQPVHLLAQEYQDCLKLDWNDTTEKGEQITEELYKKLIHKNNISRFLDDDINILSYRSCWVIISRIANDLNQEHNFKKTYEDLAYNLCAAAAKKGILVAMADLGTMYQLGFGVNRSVSEAIKWLTPAASINTVAAFELAKVYYSVLNFQESALYFKNALTLNGIQEHKDEAALALAMQYFFGLGVAQNQDLAKEKLKEIAGRKKEAHALLHLINNDDIRSKPFTYDSQTINNIIKLITLPTYQESNQILRPETQALSEKLLKALNQSNIIVSPYSYSQAMVTNSYNNINYGTIDESSSLLPKNKKNTN